MKSFKWENSMSVGVKKIDIQHKHYVGIINELNHAIETKKEAKYLDVIISELLAYLDYHFATEESYMDLYDCTGKENHKKEHKLFKKKILAIRNSHTDIHETSKKLSEYLESWLINHMNKEDKLFAQCYIKNSK